MQEVLCLQPEVAVAVVLLGDVGGLRLHMLLAEAAELWKQVSFFPSPPPSSAYPSPISLPSHISAVSGSSILACFIGNKSDVCRRCCACGRGWLTSS